MIIYVRGELSSPHSYNTMKHIKNIIWITISFLPVVPILLFALQGLFAVGTSSLSDLSFGSLSLVLTDSTAVLSWDPETIGGSILSTFWNPDLTVSAGSAGYALFYGVNMVSNVFGFSQVPFALIVATLLISYWVLLYFIRILTDLILLPIRMIERSFDYI